LEKAFDAAREAVERYPGCGRLRVELGKTAEMLQRTQIAVEQYKKAVEIEDSYRRQFRIIYPEREEIVSRIGEENYLFTKDRLKALTREESP